MTVSKTAPIAKATSAANCVRLIKEAGNSQGTMQDRFQEAAMAILVHAQAFDDCDLAKHLCRALNPHQRKSMVGFFMFCSPIGVLMGKTANEDKSRFIKVNKYNPENTFKLDVAAAKPWYTDPAKVNKEPDALGTYGSFWDAVIGMVLREKKAAENNGDKARYTPEDRASIVADANDITIILGVARAKAAAAKGANTATNDGEPLARIAA